MPENKILHPERIGVVWHKMPDLPMGSVYRFIAGNPNGSYITKEQGFTFNWTAEEMAQEVNRIVDELKMEYQKRYPLLCEICNTVACHCVNINGLDCWHFCEDHFVVARTWMEQRSLQVGQSIHDGARKEILNLINITRKLTGVSLDPLSGYGPSELERLKIADFFNGGQFQILSRFPARPDPNSPEEKLIRQCERDNLYVYEPKLSGFDPQFYKPSIMITNPLREDEEK